MTVDAPPPRRSRSGRTILVGIVVVLVILAGVVAVQLRGRESPTGLENAPGSLGTPSLADRPAPTERFALPDVELAAFGDGKPVQTASYRGTPLVVNFWAAWCAPCTREMPDFQQVAAEAEGKVRFLGVDVMDAATNAEPFVEELGITYDLAVDLRGDYWTQVRSFGMPTTLFVQPDGTVVYRHTGPLTGEQLRASLADHLGVTVQ